MTRIAEGFDTLGREDPQRTYRLGIMGGTFDPIHIGHLACAEQARETFALDAVIFIPAGMPVYKKTQQITPAKQRLAMCRLAVQSNPFFGVSALEVEREGDTFTVDTLRCLRKHYPSNVELFFITGADAVFSIITWRESSSLAHLAHLIAVTRPGYILSEQRKTYLKEHSNFSVSYLEVTALAISSSDLRAKVRTGRSIRYLTMQGVHDYIETQGLYRGEESYSDGSEAPGLVSGDSAAYEDTLTQEFYEKVSQKLEKRLDHQRFLHAESVAQTAALIAKVYGVDEKKARIAGLLHDWDKAYGDKEIRARVKKLGITVDAEVYEAMPRLLHGITAAVALKQKFPSLDTEVLQAISHHTSGALAMSALDMVVFVADVLEPLRPYREMERLRGAIGSVPLEELFLATYQQVFLRLVTKKYEIHPDTIRIWNYYINRTSKRDGRKGNS